MIRSIAAMVVVSGVLFGVVGSRLPTAGSDSPTALVTYAVPVDGPVVDPFRPPEHVGAPGNRGLEYGNPLFVPVVAAAEGTVSFAGSVFGSGTVTIDHPDGVTTTYNGLTEVWVIADIPIAKGDGVGLAGTNVHFGAIIGDRYIDPQILIDASVGGEARLVPFGEFDP